ncbi:hypothetical protein GGI43DRAFT_206656 [Trichoderma evansii]
MSSISVNSHPKIPKQAQVSKKKKNNIKYEKINTYIMNQQVNDDMVITHARTRPCFHLFTYHHAVSHTKPGVLHKKKKKRKEKKVRSNGVHLPSRWSRSRKSFQDIGELKINPIKKETQTRQGFKRFCLVSQQQQPVNGKKQKKACLCWLGLQTANTVAEESPCLVPPADFFLLRRINTYPVIWEIHNDGFCSSSSKATYKTDINNIK